MRSILGIVLVLRVGGVLFGGGQWRRRGMAEGGRQLEIASKAIGVRSPLRAPKFIWTTAWRLQQKSLPWLHRNDKAAPGNTCVNLQILWLKALAGDRNAYAMLPRYTRRLVGRPLRWFYPRLHHQNVFIRTQFLDKALKPYLSNTKRVRVIAFGAGFCTRSFQHPHIEWTEIDLPTVITQKSAIIADRRLGNEAPNLRFIPANLSDTSCIDNILNLALEKMEPEESVVFLFEAILIYLQPQAAISLLAATARHANSLQLNATLCFADRLPHVLGVEETQVQHILASTGWSCLSYLPKPGLARHMGIAKLQP